MPLLLSCMLVVGFLNCMRDPANTNATGFMWGTRLVLVALFWRPSCTHMMLVACWSHVLLICTCMTVCHKIGFHTSSFGSFWIAVVSALDHRVRYHIFASTNCDVRQWVSVFWKRIFWQHVIRTPCDPYLHKLLIDRCCCDIMYIPPFAMAFPWQWTCSQMVGIRAEFASDWCCSPMANKIILSINVKLINRVLEGFVDPFCCFVLAVWISTINHRNKHQRVFIVAC